MISSKTRIWIIILTVVAVSAAIAYGVVRVDRTLRNAYAVWWVGDMVVEHMKANDGAWPTGWQDLFDDYEAVVDFAGQAWSFEELQDRVEIDWTAMPEELMTQQKDGVATFRVIWLSDGSNAHWTGKEPNQMVFEYLNRNSGRQPENIPLPDDHVRITARVSEYLVDGWRDDFVDGFNVEDVVVFEVQDPEQWNAKTFHATISHEQADKLIGIDEVGRKCEFVIEQQMLRLAIDNELHLGWGAIQRFQFRDE